MSNSQRNPVKFYLFEYSEYIVFWSRNPQSLYKRKYFKQLMNISFVIDKTNVNLTCHATNVNLTCHATNVNLTCHASNVNLTCHASNVNLTCHASNVNLTCHATNVNLTCHASNVNLTCHATNVNLSCHATNGRVTWNYANSPFKQALLWIVPLSRLYSEQSNWHWCLNLAFLMSACFKLGLKPCI